MKFYAFFPFLLQFLAWPVAHGIFRISGSITIRGYEHIKGQRGPFVFAANHVNDLDPVLTRAMLPWFSKPLFWVARFRKDYDAHSDKPFKGWRGFLYSDLFFRAWGAYPAYKGMQNYEFALRHHLRLLKDGYSVVIFPQGGKAKHQGREAPVHGGAAFLAQKTGVPLVPVAISGTLNLGPKELFLGQRRLTVSIGKLVIIAPLTGDAFPEFYKQRMSQIMDGVHRIVHTSATQGDTIDAV